MHSDRTRSGDARRTWLSADLHLLHERIIGYTHRPFTSLEEMARCSKGADRSERWIDRYHAVGFTQILTTAQLTVATAGGPRDVTLCHFPRREESQPGRADRYKEWRPVDDGWMFCGHLHDAWQTDGHQVDVGVHVWNYAPVALETLLALKERIEASEEWLRGLHVA